MTATTHSTGDEPRETPGEDPPLHAHEITPEQDAGAVLVGVASHLCSNCGAVLATDQKYCVECGTRRGIPRFRVAGIDDPKPAAGAAGAPQAPAAAAVSARLLALLALIVVLAAIAVGVLIGHSSSHTTVRILGATAAASTSGSGSPASGGAAKSTASKSTKTSSSGASNACSAGSPGCKNGKQTGNFFGS
jgi:hypothetical protein